MLINKNIAISENGLLFHPGTGESFSVNPIGIEIIHLIRQNKSFDEITEEVLERYTTDKATFEKDYADFIAILKHNGLVTEGHE